MKKKGLQKIHWQFFILHKALCSSSSALVFMSRHYLDRLGTILLLWYPGMTLPSHDSAQICKQQWQCSHACSAILGSASLGHYQLGAWQANYCNCNNRYHV